MRRFHQLTRQALLAAFLLLPALALAEVTARYEAKTVLVEGLQPDIRADLIADPEGIVLQVAGLNSRTGMPITVTADGSTLLIKPRFALRPGTDYSLQLGQGLAVRFSSAPAPVATVPMLTGFTPSQAVIPANTLRIYLHFSEPMARGHLREAVRLFREDGTEVLSPFLTLGPELWDRAQTRGTLLLDPGRIKQGVGPNTLVGAPLKEGESYRLIIDKRMRSAAGVPLAQEATIAFRVGPPERRAIDPASWQVLAPTAGTRAPLSVAFNRIMDTGASRRLISLEDPAGQRVSGVIETDGGGWSLSPTAAWAAGQYRLRVDPELEDVAGNTPGRPFDAKAGWVNHARSAPYGVGAWDVIVVIEEPS